jgi:glycosyltransferase involved in cell wall biosynthesis
VIYLTPEVASGLGEDTFWTWAQREFPDSVMSTPTAVTKDDTILWYSTKRDVTKFPGHTIGLLWELHPEMKARLNSDVWDGTLAVIDRCGFNSSKLTVTSALMVPFYSHYNKPIDVLPIGVNTELFKPYDKAAMRAKYNIPRDRRIGIWCGTTHPMKGFDRLQTWAAQHPEVYWIIVWKTPEEASSLSRALNQTLVPQQRLAELMSCADFFLSCGRLRPFFMVEWEAMACNVPMVFLDDTEKDFQPCATPRDDIFRLKWDRITAKKVWLDYITQFVSNR